MLIGFRVLFGKGTCLARIARISSEEKGIWTILRWTFLLWWSYRVQGIHTRVTWIVSEAGGFKSERFFDCCWKSTFIFPLWFGSAVLTLWLLARSILRSPLISRIIRFRSFYASNISKSLVVSSGITIQLISICSWILKSTAGASLIAIKEIFSALLKHTCSRWGCLFFVSKSSIFLTSPCFVVPKIHFLTTENHFFHWVPWDVLGFLGLRWWLLPFSIRKMK